VGQKDKGHGAKRRKKIAFLLEKTQYPILKPTQKPNTQFHQKSENFPPLIRQKT
jgi:hypothetical protein